MSFINKVKGFFGFSEEKSDHNNSDWSQPNRNESKNSFESPSYNRPSRHYNVFTDPVEIHKYFEQQMDEMMKNFGFFGDGFTHFFNFPQSEDFPQITDIPQHYQEDEATPSSENLRDQFLKPGFEKSKTLVKRDEDIDGRLDIKDYDSIFKGQNSTTPYQQQTAPKSYFFGQSVTSKMITKPDGSTEIHRTVKDNEGNEETVITRRMDDKEYTITKKRDKDGKEEIIENLINLDEKEVDKFFPKQKDPEWDDKPTWPFDRFFK